MSDSESDESDDDQSEVAEAPRHDPAKSVCRGCSAAVLQSQIRNHVSTCPKIAQLKAASTSRGTLYRLRIVSPYLPYELIVDARGDAPMGFLDAFLRDIWMECCFHLSRFACEVLDADLDESFELRKAKRSPKMKRSISAVFRNCIVASYDYDFGTPTTVFIQRISVTKNAKQDVGIFILARNEGSALNSPREGECGYDGPSAYTETEDLSYEESEWGDVDMGNGGDWEECSGLELPTSYLAQKRAAQRKQAQELLKLLENRQW